MCVFHGKVVFLVNTTKFSPHIFVRMYAVFLRGMQQGRANHGTPLLGLILF